MHPSGGPQGVFLRSETTQVTDDRPALRLLLLSSAAVWLANLNWLLLCESSWIFFSLPVTVLKMHGQHGHILGPPVVGSCCLQVRLFAVG